jgi:ABC-type branched-subunit amino acid transport system substrate-binding protein
VAPTDWEDVWHVDYFDMADEGELRSFRARYEARFNRLATPGEVLSYDAMALLLGAIEDGARTGEDVRLWLTELGKSRPPFPGLSGPIAFDPEGQVQRSFVLSRRSAAR